MNNQLNPLALAIALGTTFAIGMAVFAVISMMTDTYGNTLISLISTVYIGYDNTVPGAIFGAVWGFVDGSICGYLIGYFYNKFLTIR